MSFVCFLFSVVLRLGYVKSQKTLVLVEKNDIETEKLKVLQSIRNILYSNSGWTFITLCDKKGLSQQNGRMRQSTSHTASYEVIIGGCHMQCFFSPLHVYVCWVYLCDHKRVDMHVHTSGGLSLILVSLFSVSPTLPSDIGIIRGLL